MTDTAPVIVNTVNGHLVVAGPEALITPALRGGAPITITGKHATGDIVWLAPLREQTWGVDDAVTVVHADIAHRIGHPQHGPILYAYIDPTRLDKAPQVAQRARELEDESRRGYAAAEARSAAMVPACDNCGNCPRCL